MNRPTLCVDTQLPVRNQATVALRPVDFKPRAQDSGKTLLTIAQQQAQAIQPGAWQRFQLDLYFGSEAQSLPFRELLLPLIWAARQLLIQRVGADYHRLASSQRAAIELSLLIKLNAALTAACQQPDRPELCGVAIAPEQAFQMALLGTFGQSLPMLRNTLAIATQWVDSVEEFLSIL